jgi:CubicO group peptidase (beta-lactamase class C family)
MIPYDLPQEGEPGYMEMDPQSLFGRVFTNPLVDIDKVNDRDWRAAEIPAGGGHGNARSVAQIGSAIACGGEVDGIRLLKMETIKKAQKEQSYGQDLVLMLPIRFGVGFGLPSKEMPFLRPNTVFWGGAGGSMIIMDIENKLSICYVMNQMNMSIVGDMRSVRLITAIYEGLSK